MINILLIFIAITISLSNLFAQQATEEQIRDVNLAEEYSKKARQLIEKGRYQEALNQCNQELAIYRNGFGDSHPTVGLALSDVAVCYKGLGEYQKALKVQSEACSVLESYYGNQNPILCNDIKNLGEIYDELGEPQKALVLFKRALSLCVGQYEVYKPRILHDLAISSWKSGKYDEAIKYDLNALSIFTQQGDVSNQMVAISMLGVYYTSKGDNKKALEYAKNAVDISKKVNGYYHENTAQAFSVLGDCNYDNGNNLEAIQAYQKSYEIAKKVINKSNPNVANILMRISQAYGRMSLYEKAIPIFQEVININKNIFGPNHKSVIYAEHNLAVTYSNIGEYERAIKILEDLVLKCKKSKSIQQVDLANIKSTLGDMYITIGKTELAKALFEDAFSIYKSINGVNDKLALITQNKLAYIMIVNGEYTKAIQLIHNCINYMDKMNRSNTPEYAEMLNNYSLANSYSGFDNEAISASLKSLSIYKKSEGNSSDNTINTLFNIATLYFKTGDIKSLNSCL